MTAGAVSHGTPGRDSGHRMNVRQRGPVDHANPGAPLPANTRRFNSLKRARAVKPAERYPSVREFFLALQYSALNPSTRSDGKPRIFISYQRDASSGWAVHFESELEQKHQISAFVDTQRMDSVVRFPAPSGYA